MQLPELPLLLLFLFERIPSPWSPLLLLLLLPSRIAAFAAVYTCVLQIKFNEIFAHHHK